jgi:hypothetical protein
MLYNPDNTGNKSMAGAYVIFSTREVFVTGVPEDSLSYAEIDNMTRFVVMFIDPGSPYFREKDFETRMRLCCKHLDIRETSGLFKKIRNLCPTLLLMITEYFKMSNNARFEAWFSTKMLFHQLSQEARTPTFLNETSISDKLKVATSLQALSQKVIELDHLMFPDEQTSRLVSEVVSAPNYAEKFALD